MNADPVNVKHTSQKSTKEVLCEKIEGDLDKIKQSNNTNKQLHLTGTLNMNLLKPAKEANPYFRFGYVPQTILNHTQGQLLVSTNADPIKVNKQVNNKRQ